MVGVCQYSCRIFIFQAIKKKNLPVVGRPRHPIGEEKLFPLLDDEDYLIILKNHALVNFLFLLKGSTPPIDVVSNFEHLLTSVQDGAF